MKSQTSKHILDRIGDTYFAVDPAARSLLLGDLEAQRLIRIGRRYGIVYVLAGSSGSMLIVWALFSFIFPSSCTDLFAGTGFFSMAQLSIVKWMLGGAVMLFSFRYFAKKGLQSIYAELHHYADALELINKDESDLNKHADRERMIDGLRWVNLEP